jgi:hypothetical protein
LALYDAACCNAGRKCSHAGQCRRKWVRVSGAPQASQAGESVWRRRYLVALSEVKSVRRRDSVEIIERRAQNSTVPSVF